MKTIAKNHLSLKQLEAIDPQGLLIQLKILSIDEFEDMGVWVGSNKDNPFGKYYRDRAVLADGQELTILVDKGKTDRSPNPYHYRFWNLESKLGHYPLYSHTDSEGGLPVRFIES